MKKIILLLLLTPFISFAQWGQLGADIDGDAEGDRFGRSLSLNDSGTTMVVGAESNDVNGDSSGLAKVFDFDGTDWIQRGEDINGLLELDQFGGTVRISNDGNTIAITATFGENSLGFKSGTVRILDWNGTSWAQRGAIIEGDGDTSPLDDLDTFGQGLSLSADTNTIAIGGPSNREFGNNAGHVRVFDWDGSSWIQKGEDLTRSIDVDKFGFSVNLSADGNRLIVGAPGSNNFSTNTNGIIRTYDWDGTAWQQVGTDIEGLESGDSFGKFTALNPDGTVLASGGPDLFVIEGNVACTARVFEWDGTDWAQRGETFNAEEDADSLGAAVSLSDDGNTFAVSAPGLFTGGNTYIYKWDGVNWEQQGETILGEATSDLSGAAISLNAMGDTIAVGAYANDENGTSSGHARVFQNLLLGTELISLIQISHYPNPVENETTFTANEIIKDLTIYSILGQELFTLENTGNAKNMTIDLSHLSAGNYFAQINTATTLQTIKLVKN